MNPTIAALDDRTAVRVLNTLTLNALEPAPPPLEPELFAALKQEHAADASPSVSQGDVARAALELLAANPEMEPQIVALAAQPPAEQFDFGLVTGAVVLTLALKVLQTQTDIAWDKKKGLRITLKTRAASDTVLRQFLAKLSGFKP